MSHLLVIVDCSPSPTVNQKQFIRWLDSVITFCNSHLMLDEKNELTVVASFSSSNKTILSTKKGLGTNKDIIPQQGQFEKFAFVTDIIRNGIVDLIKKSPPQISNDCMLASAMGMSLCMINNMKKISSRILIVSCSMQKMNVPIDGCVYMKEESKRGSILEQGCDLTGGHFLNVPDIAGVLEYLLWIFLPSTEVRETLLLPEKRKATHRAACFCHRNIIDIGYVCSVCLSIFCTYNPICSNCQTHFKLDIPAKVINKFNGTGSQNSGSKSKSQTQK